MMGQRAVSIGLWFTCAAACVVAHCIAPAAVRASCPSPTMRVLWLSPADGARDVPVDVDLFLIFEDLPPASVSLNQEVLEGDPEIGGVFDLGDLAPDTTYTIEVGWPDAGERFTFTTAADSRHVADAPSLELRAMEEGTCADWDCDIPAACQEIAYSRSCFDTGFPIFQQFTVEGSALAYAIETLRKDDGGRRVALVPSSCGAPRVLTWGLDDANRSYRIHALGADGSRVASALIEGPGALDGASAAADGGEAEGPAMVESGAAGGAQPQQPEATGGCSLIHSGHTRIPDGNVLLLMLALIAWRRHTAGSSLPS